jgi:glucose-1-phosphate cytidylyltransferase
LFPHHGYWLGMDTYRDLTELTDLWSSGEAPWKVWSG